MNHTLAKRLFSGIAACFFIVTTILVFGCSGTKINAKYGKNSDQGYSKAEHKHKHKKGGPPAHAPAHGYRPNTNIAIIPIFRFTITTKEGFIFTSAGATWRLVPLCPATFRGKWETM